MDIIDSGMREAKRDKELLGEELDDGFVPEDARPVCLKCLRPCDRLQYYCGVCGSHDAINPLAPYIGFVNIWFNYGIFLTMWRQVCYGREISWIVRLFYLLMVTLFVPFLIIVGLPALLVVNMGRPAVRKGAIIALFILAIVLLIFLWLSRIRGSFRLGPIILF